MSPKNCLIINFKPQKWIPDLILILLDAQNLSVHIKLLFLDFAKNGNWQGKWQMWQCIIWTFFDVETSYGGLKVSEFNQEFIFKV